MTKDTIIIGGGLAGLTAALNLGKKGHEVMVIEKNEYPFHKVCGEYVSKEIMPVLDLLNANPHASFNLPQINRFQLSTNNGKTINLQHNMGGFGISRYVFDHFLYKKAQKLPNVEVLTNAMVVDVNRDGQYFKVNTSGKSYFTRTLLGSHGKKSKLDQNLKRNFVKKRSPYVGIKYHIDYPQNWDQVSLHSFKRGYAGISKIENGHCCFCYMVQRDQLKQFKSIQKLEQEVLKHNPYLKHILEEATFLWKQPLVINEVSFQPKTTYEQGMLMAGDSAGMIAPLAGNGMAMAIHGGYMASSWVHQYLNNKIGLETMYNNYAKAWKHQFSNRFRSGKFIQDHLFFKPSVQQIIVPFAKTFPFLGKQIIGMTHGKPVQL